MAPFVVQKGTSFWYSSCKEGQHGPFCGPERDVFLVIPLLRTVATVAPAPQSATRVACVRVSNTGA